MSQASPQQARLVAYRALCLGALLKRHELEMRVKTLNDYVLSEEDRRLLVARRHTMNHHLYQWVLTEGLSPYLTPAETHLFNAPLGTWSTRILMHVSWRTETLGILLWALRAVDTIPSYDTLFELDLLLRPLDIGTASIDFVWCASLRPLSQLQHMRDSAELWTWRGQAMELQRLGVRPVPSVSFGEIIRATAEQAHRNGTLPSLIDGDFPAFGKAYATLSDDEFDLTRSITQERTTAINWLTEGTTEWQHLPID